MKKLILTRYIQVAMLIIIFLTGIFFINSTQASNGWIVNAGSKIATSKSFPHEFGGLTVSDTSVYISLENGIFYRLDPKGNTIWRLLMQDYSIYPPVEDDTTTYITSFDGRLYAINTKTGKEQWRFSTPNLLKADTEPVVSNNLVYFGSRNGILYALDKKTGKIVWTFQTTPIDRTLHAFDEPVFHFGRFTVDTTKIYINSSTDNTIYALDQTSGKILWTLPQYGFIYQQPKIKGNTLIIQNNKGEYLFLNKNTGAVLQQDAHVLTSAPATELSTISNKSIDPDSVRIRGETVYALTQDHMGVMKFKKNQKIVHDSLLPKKQFKIPQPKTQTRVPNFAVSTQDLPAKKYSVYVITVTADDAPYVNPQSNVQIVGIFTAPNGTKYKTNGFYYDKNTWQMRFTPNLPGAWTWTLTVKNSSGTQKETGLFNVTDSDNPGFLTISLTNPQTFRVDRRSFVPVGLQDCIQDTNQDGNPLDQWFPGTEISPPVAFNSVKAFSMDEYLSLYQKSGFNFWRYGVENCSRALWLEINQKGNRYSLNESFYIDQLFAALKAHKYHIWMSLFSFQLPFDTNLKTQEQRAILKDYLQYVVSRYGAYIDVWELTNEIRLADDTIAFMVDELKKIDPYHHPITTSWERPDNPNIEINSLHWYDSECDLFCAQNVSSQVMKYKTLKKPTVFSEAGNHDANWDDTSADRLRVRLWITYFQNTSSIFWNSSMGYFSNPHGTSNIYLGPMERSYTRVFSSIIQTLSVEKDIGTTSENQDIKVFSKASNTETLTYVYRRIRDPIDKSTTLHINPASNGTIAWIDPKSGDIIGNARIHSGKQTVASPLFKVDILLRIRYDD